MSQTEQEFIEEALFHLNVLESHLERGDLDDPLILDAVTMRLAAAIESLSYLPEDRRRDMFGEDWHAMWSTRNRIAHRYVRLDNDVITRTIERRVTPLVSMLQQARAEMDDQPAESDS
jgi:uncharacterized protein with HEPN domain